MTRAGRERQLHYIKSEEIIMFGFGQLIDILKKILRKSYLQKAMILVF